MSLLNDLQRDSSIQLREELEEAYVLLSEAKALMAEIKPELPKLLAKRTDKWEKKARRFGLKVLSRLGQEEGE